MNLDGFDCVSTISLSISTVIKTVHFVSCHTRQQQRQQRRQQQQRQLQILQLNKSKAQQATVQTVRLSNTATDT